jgi:hypothetical protein
MIDQVKDYAWGKRTSVSQLIREVLEDFCKNPKAYIALDDMGGTLSGSLTVYVPDDLWYNARDLAYLGGRVPLSVVIRKGIHARMTAESITETA